jgi:DNA-binding CsgD family transcriptional regulator
VEAALHAGRRDAAEAALARYAAEAERGGGPAALALLARCRGLLAEDDEFEREFAEALGRHGEEDGGFARARTELSLGERRRRAGRRRAARPPLRSALATFERLGADAWAERARLELEATGERLSLDTPGLTAQERRVAAAVAAGATNREAAAALHLSPRTVEYHLRKVFRKLGVRSRTELSRVLGA